MYNKILLPVDLGAGTGSPKMAENAISIAKLSPNAEIHVVSVLPTFGVSVVSDFFTKDHEERALHDMGDKLQKFVAENFPKDVKVRPHVLHGAIYEEIIRAAKKLECDLIIMGSHRPELQDYLLGPNAARVVRHSPMSVLVVRR